MKARTAALGLGAGTLGVALGAVLSIAAQRAEPVHRQNGPGTGPSRHAAEASSPSGHESGEPLEGHVPPGTFLAWIPGEMPPRFQQRADALHGMRHAVVVANDTTWMSRSYAASGELVDDPTPPYEVPLDTAAVTPADFAPFLPPADRSVIGDLARGEGVLGASSARLRGLGPGAVLEFGSVRVPIAAVLPDELVGANELLVDRDIGRRIGVVHDRYALLAPHPAPAAPALASELRPLAGGSPIQVRAPGDTPFLRQGDAVLPPVQIKERFGEFDARPAPGPGGFLEIDPSWVHAHIATRQVPLLGEITCNQALFPQLIGAMRELRRRGLGDLVQTQHGCYVPKFVLNSPTAAISHHSWGIAFDINLAGNEYGEPPHQPPRLVRVLERWGFVWGGTFIVPDGNHFEYHRPPSAGV